MNSETRLERINKLDKACEVLKSEFIGLDSIIDNIKLSITPWYITPEVIERPVVVSLWGMTGTGKTSVIRRLLELLDLSSHAMCFDCGSENKDRGEDLSDVIHDFITSDGDSEIPIDSKEARSFAIVFDEFQYARTLDEHGEEVDKPNLRPIWNLLDSGILSINRVSKYDLGYFNDFIDDLTTFAEDHLDMPLNNGMVENRDDVRILLNTLGFFYFDRGVPDVMDPCSSYGYDSSHLYGKDDEEEDPFRPIKVLEDRLMRIIYRKTGTVGKRPKELDDIFACKTLGELIGLLKDYKARLNTVEEINCSKSIIFVVGNLDEAFKVSSDINPDLSADVFYEETSKVTDSDIKTALQSRFRAEQIARFGNSIIKYPSLNRECFEKIISKEVTRICEKFKCETKIDVTVTNNFLDLIYSEGVYPVQGVRPVFTTIGTIFTPLLSKVVMKNEEEAGNISSIIIDVLSPESGYKLNKKTVTVKYQLKDSIEKVENVEVKLSLGQARNPENRKTAYINSVHEAGHAIVMAYLTGKLPISIVSVSTDHGGFCVTFDKDKIGEIDSKRDINNSVMIGLGGYEAEHLIYSEDPDITLLGSGSDISVNWDVFTDAVYNCGYFDPYAFTNLKTESGCGGAASGFDDSTIIEKIKTEFDKLRNQTREILSSNTNLLVETALMLGELGEINEVTFRNLIENYGNTLSIERLEEAKELNSPKRYKDILLSMKKK